MSAPVEAQSLSNLTNLFANPPQYPRNPTHSVHEPLVLYIVRVPGSKDVFLSPLKPPTKATISLEAIQSSLYYFHVNTVEDEELRRSLDKERRSEDSSRPSVVVARKPLPTTPVSTHPLPMPPEEPQQYQPYQSHYDTWTSNGVQHNDADTQMDSPNLRLDTRVRPFAQQKQSSPIKPANALYNAAGDYALSPSVQNDYSAHNIHNFQATHYQSDAPGSRTMEEANSFIASQHYPHNASASRTAAAPFLTTSTASCSSPITMIRRDPATGSQWNIGTIALLQPSFTGSNIRPVSVELSTPGYGRFARAGFETPRPGSARSDVVSIRKAMESATVSPMSATTPVTPTMPFSRLVDFKKMAVSDLRRTAYQRTDSSDSVSKVDPSRPGVEKNVLTFESPWHGTCTFVNAIDGTSLKIKHTISSNSSAAESITANIGELRFNLGWSLLSNIKDSGRRRKEPEPEKLPIPDLLKTKKENFRKSFQQLKNRSRESFQRNKSSEDGNDILRDLSNVETPTTNNINGGGYPKLNVSRSNGQYDQVDSYPHHTSSAQPPSSEENDEEGRISLRLGREKAGGGFRGQSAKLGKLIIEDEGLKMCDLVVGAAMGIWWQHYEG